MLLPLLGSAVVGGLIGYLTNWLAIKMLFWPLREKRLWGWRVPFTPGLIPKKRGKLAESLGETVASHLVTPATLDAALAAPEFGQLLQNLIGNIWGELRSRNQSVGEVLDDSHLLPKAPELADRAATAILRVLQSEVVQEMLWQAGLDAGKVLGKSVQMHWHSEPTAGDWVSEALTHLTESEKWHTLTTDWVSKAISSRLQQTNAIGELFPNGTKEMIRSYILSSGPDWLDRLQLALQSANSRMLIKRLIKDSIATNPVLKMLAAFADLDRIAESLPGLLAKDEVRMRVILLVLEALDKAWEQPVNQLVLTIFPEGVSVAQVGGWLAHFLSSAQMIRYYRSFCNWLRRTDWVKLWPDLQEMVGPLSILVLPRLRQSLKNSLASDQVIELLSGVIRKLLDRLLSLPIGRALPALSQDRLIGWRQRTHQLLSGLVKRYGREFLTALQLPKIVEAQVNALDIVDVEEILLRVMREQLHAITNLGFLLGAIIGLVMPYLNGWLSGF